MNEKTGDSLRTMTWREELPMDLGSRDVAETPRSTMSPEARKPCRSGDCHELKKDIQRRIRSLTGDGIQDLCVTVYADRIVIEGRCWTFYCKQLAQHAVMQLAPGEPLSNRIEVVAP
jgi:hypothetical protein